MSKNHRRLCRTLWRRLREEVIISHGFRCAECLAFAVDVHHVKPLSEGGEAYSVKNLQALCRDCHIGKHMSESRRELRSFVRELER